MSVIDSTVREVNGVRFRICVVGDHEVTPDEFDCYSSAELAAWRNDEWLYVGVIVTPLVDGINGEAFKASLWGVEFGLLSGRLITVDTLADEHPVPDLISECASNMIRRLPVIMNGLPAIIKSLPAIVYPTKETP